MERIIFYILALMMIVFAIASVSSRKMLRSVIYLLFVLTGVAGIFFLIDYNFLAAVELTVYAGGIIVLMIFSVLLVHHIELKLDIAKVSKRVLTSVACAMGAGTFISIIYSYDFDVVGEPTTTTTAEIGTGLLSYTDGGFILPFEVISVLLLAAMVGAIIIAKGRALESDNNESE